MEMMASSSTNNIADVKETKKPSNSAFKQQRLTAWQPILTAGTVLPTFFVIGILFIPVGIGLWFFSDNVKEISIPYTNCSSTDPGTLNQPCDQVLKNNKSSTCHCEVSFRLESSFQGKVYMYYALTNFYQNHRRYVKSRDDSQLWGDTTNRKPASDCKPFDYDGSKIIFPCGAIANSMFSDEITLNHISDQGKKQVPLKNTGIAWESDKRFKFKNPPEFGKNATMWETFTKPKYWKKNLWELDPNDKDNNGLQNEDFIVWMRTAALPNFKKLYRIVNTSTMDGSRGGLIAGNYTLDIVYTYDVESFHGTKSVVLSTTSLLGGKNPFLGISYIIVGTICLVLGIAFLFIHINYGKSTWEMTNVDPRTPY